MKFTKIEEKTLFLSPNFVNRMLFFLSADFLLFFITLYVAYSLRFDFAIPAHFMAKFYIVFFTLLLLKWSSFYLFGIYRMTWRFFGLHDAKQLFYAHILASGGFFLLYWINAPLFLPMPRSVIGIDIILSLVLVGGLRFSKRLLVESTKTVATKATLIIGVSPNTANLIKSMMESSHDYYPTSIIAIEESTHNMIGSTI